MYRIATLAGLFVLAGVASAQTFNLVSLNASARLTVGSAAGGFGPVRDLAVNGDDVLFEQGYWVSINGGALTQLDSFATTATLVSPDRLDVDYADAASGLRFNVRYLLTGSGGAWVDLAEVVTVVNGGNSVNSMAFYQFNDFDLNGFLGDVGLVQNSSTIRQTDGLYSATVGVTGIPSELGIGNSGSAFNAMAAGSLTTLSQTNFGPADVAFVYRWNVQLARNDVWQMSANKIAVVPEPMTIAALGLGLAALARRRRKG